MCVIEWELAGWCDVAGGVWRRRCWVVCVCVVSDVASFRIAARFVSE